MFREHISYKKTILAAAAAGALLAFTATGSSASDTSIQTADSGQGQGQGQGGGQGGEGGKGQGKGGHSIEDLIFAEDEDEESERPDWAGVPGKEGKPGKGNAEPGVSKGTLFGDLYVILRDENGVPILDENDNVQPILIDGTVVQLTPEGDLPTEYADLVQEVDFGRLNVGRAPWHVLDARYNEVESLLNDDNLVSLSLDASGRLVATLSSVDEDGNPILVEKTIDAPLENLAIYVALMNSGTLAGVSLTPEQMGELDFMFDGALTDEDVAAAASFLAAAADKTGEFSVDEIVYYNSIVGVTGTDPIMVGDLAYYDYSTFTYDRASVYDGITAEVLVQQPDGTWTTETVDIYSVIFGDTNYTSDGGAEGFAQAAEDALNVIEFIHEYAPPESF